MKINQVNQSPSFGTAISIEIPKKEAIKAPLFAVFKEKYSKLASAFPSKTGTHDCFYFEGENLRYEEEMEELLKGILFKFPYTRDKRVTNWELFKKFCAGEHNNVGVIEAE